VKPEDDHEPDRPAWGFPEFVETPRILWDRRKGVLRDLVGFSRVFIISGAAKRVFETVDAGAFAFLLCESVLPDCPPEGPRIYETLLIGVGACSSYPVA
jgi:Protein of unknown function (DUF1629)